MPISASLATAESPLVFIVRAALAVLLLAAGGGGLLASADANATPGSSAGTYNQLITADDLKPPECAGITLTNVLAGSGVIIGIGNRNELIVGSAGVDDIRGMLGDDCLLGGAGDDSLDGGGRPPGNDVCIGGGDAGDVFIDCETVIP